jgi:hypothetical protein
MSIPNGFGKHIEFASPEQIENFSRLAFISEPTWVWSLTFTKVSIAFMFLRIRNTPGWKAIMSFAIFYLVASAIVTTALQFTECTPLRMYWEKVPGGTCRSPESVQKAIIGTSGTLRAVHKNHFAEPLRPCPMLSHRRIELNVSDFTNLHDRTSTNQTVI